MHAHQVNIKAVILLTTLTVLVWLPSFREWNRILSLRSKDQHYLDKSALIRSKYLQKTRDTIYKPLKMSSHTAADNNNPITTSMDINNFEKQNATFVMLARNSDLNDAVEAIKSLESRFNHKYHYDWTFFNDVPFDEDFIRRTTEVASGKTQYGLIPKDNWDIPSWINKTTMNNNMNIFNEENMLYGSSISYRNMCRYNSGFFFRQKLLDGYDYYMRVDPDVHFLCDLPYDPFEMMVVNHKKYGFVITMHEIGSTIPTLWDTVKKFISQHSDLINKNNLLGFLTDKNDLGKNKFKAHFQDDYNLCHFWTNLEVGDLNFFRSDKYLKFFDFLDANGGFYYERWGDAPIHSIAAALFLDKDEIIHFEEIGYHHMPYYHCPMPNAFWDSHKCACSRSGQFNVINNEINCLPRYWKHNGKTFVKEPGHF
ncbi:hypothetical protein B1J92_I04378g [Nakaseomyces glabratus]|nr:hypothetical protein B1J91_I04378g [Nakaseomyces glabratus]OXB49353.1 hypothetical protein B1J92_I04378g [Nakaseomyces glabratus]